MFNSLEFLKFTLKVQLSSHLQLAGACSGSDLKCSQIKQMSSVLRFHKGLLKGMMEERDTASSSGIVETQSSSRGKVIRFGVLQHPLHSEELQSK